MAARSSRIPSSLLAPPCLRPVIPRGREISTTRYLSEQQQLQTKPETVANPKTYERTSSQLPYTAPRRITHARPQPRAPFPMRPKRPFPVNDDSAKLDAMYSKLLGSELELSEDVKWQAVTHKTFDHGRQPYNEKLAFFGKQIMQMHVSLLLLGSPMGADKQKPAEPSTYTSVDGELYLSPEPSYDYGQLDSVTRANIANILSSSRLYSVVHGSGLEEVMRWKPADVKDLSRSGKVKVSLECLHAIIGAVALQKGGDAAGRFVRDKILRIR